MLKLSMPPVVVLLLTGTVGAATLTVQNNRDSGLNSLRWAINRANNVAGPDTIVFAPAMAGQGIAPVTVLPALTDDATTINGDINGDGLPDVAINGRMLLSGTGLTVLADQCVIRGLAIVRFRQHGIYMIDASYCTVHSLYLSRER